MSSPALSDGTPLGPVLVVTRQGIELRNPASSRPFATKFALVALLGVAVSVAVRPTAFDLRSVALTLIFLAATRVSSSLAFRTTSNHIQTAPTLLYVVAAAVLVGPLAAVAAGIVMGATTLTAPRAAQVFSASLGALHGAAAGVAVAFLATGDTTRHPLAVCVGSAAFAGVVWATGQAVMYRARLIPMVRFWRVEIPSTAGEIAVAAGAAPALVVLYADVGFSGVMLFAAIVISAFAVFCHYRTRLLALHAEVERLSLSDPLTGVANRRAFDERLEHECRRVARGGSRFALFLVDLDRFKEINDGYGHAAGDAAIRETAQRLSARMRGEDMVARIGGDELAVIATEVSDASAVASLAVELARTVKALPVVHDGQQIPVTLSIGAELADDAPRPDELLRAADRSLYTAKAAGRDCVAVAGRPTDPV